MKKQDSPKLLLLISKIEEAKDVSSFLEKKGYKITLVGDLSEAKKKAKNSFFDAILIDIMKEAKSDGIAFAEYINNEKLNIPFLFLTDIQTKSVFDKAKKTKPFIYLLKPYNELELLYSLELAIDDNSQQIGTISFKTGNAFLIPSFIFLKKRRSVMKIDVSSINYIEVREKYCSLKCDEGSFLIKLALKQLIKQLSNPNFVQVQRNFLVNITKIREIYLEDNLIILDSKERIPFSQRYKASFVKTNTIFR